MLTPYYQQIELNLTRNVICAELPNRPNRRTGDAAGYCNVPAPWAEVGVNLNTATCFRRIVKEHIRKLTKDQVVKAFEHLTTKILLDRRCKGTKLTQAIRRCELKVDNYYSQRA